MGREREGERERERERERKFVFLITGGSHALPLQQPK